MRVWRNWQMRRISVLSPQWRITVPFLVPAIFKTEYAPVMELVDMRDLGSRAAMRVGSSPFRRTKPIGEKDYLQKKQEFSSLSRPFSSNAKGP